MRLLLLFCSGLLTGRRWLAVILCDGICVETMPLAPQQAGSCRPTSGNKSSRNGKQASKSIAALRFRGVLTRVSFLGDTMSSYISYTDTLA